MKEKSSEKSYAKPFNEIPGPRELPLIGNSWRFAPIIGDYLILINFGGFQCFDVDLHDGSCSNILYQWLVFLPTLQKIS